MAKTTYDCANDSKLQIMHNAMITAYAVVAVLGRKEDELSEKEAFSLYGRVWVKDRTKRGMLKFSRSGATIRSAKNYSRFEIEALKMAEKGIKEQWENVIKEAEKLKTKIKD